MVITKTATRTLTLLPNEDGFLLIERTRYVPTGYTRGKWDEQRIWIHPDELQKLQAVKG